MTEIAIHIENLIRDFGPVRALDNLSLESSSAFWDTTHLGFNAWSERRRVKFSHQYTREKQASQTSLSFMVY